MITESANAIVPSNEPIVHLTREENELLTQTGPGTAAGELLRRYWQPAALSEELPPGGAPSPVKVLSEELVLFRNEQGLPGLLALHCSHRGADLSYGRLEDGGLRCIYHGWLYDIHGRCLEQPGEPAGSTFYERIRHTAYRCREVGGIIFAYMGPGESPVLPAYEPLLAPEQRRLAKKHFSECNYLQSHEGNMDQQHVSFLHRSNPDAYPDRKIVSPTTETEETDFGGRAYSIRAVAPDTNLVGTTCFVTPNINLTSNDHGGYMMGWHVPIDDFSHWRYSVRFWTEAMDDESKARLLEDITDTYRLVRNKANRYLQDRESMKTVSYSGIGTTNGAQDACMQEGMGAIQDRAQENLVPSDCAIVMLRSRLLEAIRIVQAGGDPPNLVRAPAQLHRDPITVYRGYLPSSESWWHFWENRGQETTARYSTKLHS